MNELKIALVCNRSVLGDIEGNLRRMVRLAERATEAGAHVVCFPECAATGYGLKDPSKYCSTQETDGIVDHLLQMGQKMQVVLIAGLIENKVGFQRPFITQLITGPEGLIGRYRKTHLSPKERDVFEAGDALGSFQYENWCFGLQLCYEAHFPEISTKMALSGADLLLVPHASPRGKPFQKLESWMRHLPARAFDNGVFVAACNPVGENGAGLSFPGVALLLSPDGRLIEASYGMAERVVLSTLKREDLETIRAHPMKYFLPERRPELYR